MGKILSEVGPYKLWLMDETEVPSSRYRITDDSSGALLVEVVFQSGPVEKGVNGVPDLLLIEMVAHRLGSMQDGPNPSPYNEWGLMGLLTYAQSQVAHAQAMTDGKSNANDD